MVNHPFLIHNPYTYILLVVLYILPRLSRQADSELRQCLWSESRSRSRRPRLFLGSFNHQHQLSRLCLSLYAPSPKTPNWKIVSGNMTLWGAILTLTTLAHNFAGLMALRFVLGGAEACIGPAWMLLTSMFWTREEQPLRIPLWLGCNGLSSMVGAGLSWGLRHTQMPNSSGTKPSKPPQT
jgi:MFS family permease